MIGWKSQFARVGLGAAMVASMLGASAAPSSAAMAKRPMAVVARDFQFIVPPVLPAGDYDLRFFNISRDEDHVFVAVNLGSKCSNTINTVAQAKALLARIDQESGGDEDASDAVFARLCPGGSFEGAAFAEPGGRAREDFTFTPGKTLYFCPIPDEDGTPHSDLGMIGFMNIFSLPTGR